MANIFLTDIDLVKNELQNASIQNLATAPLSPVIGQIYYDTTDSEIKVWTGLVWSGLGGDITKIDITAGDALSGSVTTESGEHTQTLDVLYDDTSIELDGTGSLSLKATGVVANTYGSDTAIPVITVDSDGRITSVLTESISTDLDILADTGSETVSLASETLTISGGDGVETEITVGVGGPNVIIDLDTTVVRTSGDQTIAGNKTFSNNVIISGDLIVSGAQTTKVSENVLVEDNIITLNSNETGIPSENAGIEVERGAEANAQLIWNETTDKWQIEVDPDNDTYQNVATEDYVAASVSSKSYATTITGDGTWNNIDVAYPVGWSPVNVSDVMVQVVGGNATVFTDVVRASDGLSVNIGFGNSVPLGVSYRILMTLIGG